MRGALQSFRGVMVVVLALLVAASALLGQGRHAAAYFDFTYLDGLEQAVTRNSYGDDFATTGYLSIELSTSVARFDSEDHASAGYDEVTGQYAIGYASYEPGATPEASAVDDLGDATMAYTSVSYTEIVLEWWMETTVLVTREAELVYIVSAVFQHDQEPQSRETMALARALMTSMLDADAGEGDGTLNPDGTSTGGLWDTLPTLDHEALQPLALAYAYDFQDYPELATPELVETEEDDAAFDFGGLQGIERAVGRFYAGDLSLVTTPETAPAGTYYLVTAVIAFGSDGDAEAAVDPLAEAFREETGSDLPFALEEVDTGDLGDRAEARFGSGEEEGITYELALLTVQDGEYVYIVAAIGIGDGAGTLDTATAVVEEMIDADAGDGDGEFDETGGSTGGLWDKLPAEGDEVVEGLSIESDDVIYPEPEE